MTSSDLIIRSATVSDRAAVLALVPRLRAFGKVPLRSAHELDTGEARTLNRYFDAAAAGTHLWVAERRRSILGAAFAETLTDYFTQEKHAHLGIMMVAAEAEGQGVGRALMDTVERWARDQKSRFLTLNVFAANERARAFYERSEFRADYLRFMKPLTDDD